MKYRSILVRALLMAWCMFIWVHAVSTRSISMNADFSSAASTTFERVQHIRESIAFAAPISCYWRASDVFSHPESCGWWREGDYWRAMLALFGTAYPRMQVHEVPPGMSRVWIDGEHNWYVRDADRLQFFEQFSLYHYDSFWQFIQAFPEYERTIIKLYERVAQKKDLQKKFSKKALGTLKKEHARIGQKVREQESMQRAQHQHLTQQQEAQRQVQETFAAQQNDLEAHVDEWNTLLEITHEYFSDGRVYVEKRMAAWDAMHTNGVIYTQRAYPLSSEMALNGEDAKMYERCYGNQLQHVLHQECLDLITIVRSTEPIDTIVYPEKESLRECIDAACAFNQEGLCANASMVADFCWSLLDYGAAVLEGAAQGAVYAVRDIVEHPVQAAACIVAGEYVLVYHLGKIVWNVADIGITALHDREKAAQEWSEYIAPITSLIDAIEQKKISLRDGVKGTAAFVVGWKAQNKLLGGLGKFYTNTKNRALEWAKNNPTLNPQEYMATAEGVLIRTCCSPHGFVVDEGIAQWTRDNRMEEFLKWQRECLAVNNTHFVVTEHFINSLRKSGRKNIMPDHVINALKQNPVNGDIPFSWKYVDPQSGVRVFVNECNELVGVQPLTFI